MIVIVIICLCDLCLDAQVDAALDVLSGDRNVVRPTTIAVGSDWTQHAQAHVLAPMLKRALVRAVAIVRLSYDARVQN